MQRKYYPRIADIQFAFIFFPDSVNELFQIK